MLPQLKVNELCETPHEFVTIMQIVKNLKAFLSCRLVQYSIVGASRP